MRLGTNLLQGLHKIINFEIDSRKEDFKDCLADLMEHFSKKGRINGKGQIVKTYNKKIIRAPEVPKIIRDEKRAWFELSQTHLDFINSTEYPIYSENEM